MKIINTRIENITIEDLKPLKEYDEPSSGSVETSGYIVVSMVNNEYDQILWATGSIGGYTPAANEKILHIIQAADFVSIDAGLTIKAINVEEIG